ncbi:Potassium channel protein [Geitlerinema sp. FC II]|nr:Potassium channel protein [Geitlerinema sp. FC II]
MHESFQRILTGAIFFLLTIAIAIFGYVLFGWELIDAIYMVIITIFGVGYGEVQPLETPAEKLFTIGVIVAGTSSAVYIVGGFVQMVTEGEINRAFESRRKTQGIERLERHSIVCGFGRMGEILAKKLHEARKPFAIVDNDPDRMALAESLGYLVRLGSAADEEVLKSVGIDRAKCLATVLSDDALNVFITLTARELNPNLTILARGELPSTGKKLQLAGADRIVLPAEIGALQMSNYQKFGSKASPPSTWLTSTWLTSTSSLRQAHFDKLTSTSSLRQAHFDKLTSTSSLRQAQCKQCKQCEQGKPCRATLL